jgi:hypothetical protein
VETKWLASSLFRLAVFLGVSFNSTLTEAGQRRIFQTCWQTLLVSDGYPERILPFFDLYTKDAAHMVFVRKRKDRPKKGPR